MLELGAPSPKAGSDSYATMHIKLKWSLHWSGAEPDVREERAPYAPNGYLSLNAFASACALPSPHRWRLLLFSAIIPGPGQHVHEADCARAGGAEGSVLGAFGWELYGWQG